MSLASAATVGVIGGSGLYQIEGLTDAREVKVATPFGKSRGQADCKSAIPQIENLRYLSRRRNGDGGDDDQ